MTPQRVQVRRGERAPAGAVDVSRGAFRNPFAPRTIPGWATASREYAAEDFRRWVTTPCTKHPVDGRLVGPSGGNRDHLLGVPYEGRPSMEAIKKQLGGRTLACTCPLSQPCHADVLLDLARTAPDTTEGAA